MCLGSVLTLTGVAVGAGWQGYVTYVNLACYYLVGIPIGIILGYVVGLQVKVSFIFFIIFSFFITVLKTKMCESKKINIKKVIL